MTRIFLLEEEEPSFFNVACTQEAWRQWEIYSCVERNGGHDWILLLEEPDDGHGNASLECEHCPVGVDDIFPDGQEFLYFNDGAIWVEDGRHNSQDEMKIPVTVNVWSHHYNNPDFNEWDAGIDLEKR